MIKATLYVDTPYLGNEIFNKDNTILNRDDCLEGFRILKKILKEKKIDLSTQDINKIKNSQLIIYNDIPECLPQYHNPEISILILFESAVVKPTNWYRSNHDNFKYILTWNDDFVDESKYFKFFYSQPNLLPNKKRIGYNRKKFCTMIAANKTSPHKNELYSSRADIIRWFERKYPEMFDLFGYNWDKGIISNSTKTRRRLERLFPLLKRKIFYPIKTYKGIVSDKIKVLAGYKYCICYENAKNIPGYITEKIFDCFIAGTLPVYLGPPNIGSFIPDNCYIDKKNFKTIQSLFIFLKNLNDEKYVQYCENIDNFLNSPQAKYFSTYHFAELISNLIYKMNLTDNIKEMSIQEEFQP